jgi:hypothetical protein
MPNGYRPQISFDSLMMPPLKQRRKNPKKHYNVVKKGAKLYRYQPLAGVGDVAQMIARPDANPLMVRLKDCYRRLEKAKQNVAVTKHYSPRGNSRRRRSRRRSPKSRKVRRREHSYRRNGSTRRHRRSPRRSSRRRY